MNMMEIPSVYIETSIASYLTARPTSELLAAAFQKMTVDWWEIHRRRYLLFTSQVTIEEAGRGDPDAASRRLAALENIPILPVTEGVVELAVGLLELKALPNTAQVDALHIAVSAAHRMDFLLTWNFRHIANATNRSAIREICRSYGYIGPEICTPRELLGEFRDV